jgi:protein-disulfide isomerase
MSAQKASRQAKASARQQRSLHHAQQQRKKKRLLAIIGGSLAVAIVAIGILALINRDGGGSDLPEIVAVSAPDQSLARDGMTIGSPDAPIKLVEYGDYQCPYCAMFNENAMPPLLAEYVASGQVQLTFVPFSFLGDESNRAAEAAACAVDQGLFWEMHEGIYGNHAGENEGAYSDARLRQIAGNAGLDLDTYDACMSDGTHESQIGTWNAQASAAGVTSTPSFTINGGAPFSYQNWEQFSGLIDEALGQ